MKKPLIVGQAPSRKAGQFRGRSGRRLAALLGVEHEKLEVLFDVVNLIPHFPGKDGKGDAFPMNEARDAAKDLDVWNRPFVLLVGKQVARACGVARPRYFELLVFQRAFAVGKGTFKGQTGNQSPARPSPTIPAQQQGKMNLGEGAGCLSIENVPAFCIPHPSGVNRWWNDPENRERAEAFMQFFPVPRTAEQESASRAG